MEEIKRKLEAARADKIRFANGKTLGDEFEDVSKDHLHEV